MAREGKCHQYVQSTGAAVGRSEEVKEEEELYNFRPYTYVLVRVSKVQLFEGESKEINLTPRESIPVKAPALLGIVGPTLLPLKVESGERTIYKPRPILR